MVKENLFGFLIKTSAENNDMYNFYSSDAIDETKRPMLTIEYVPYEIEPVDPGWECVNVGAYQGCLPIELGVISSPFNKASSVSGDYGEVGYSGGMFLQHAVVAALLKCEPYPRCVNDYPIHYRIEYEASWIASGATNGNLAFRLEIPGGVNVDNQRSCGIGTTNGRCKGFFEGTISIYDLPPNTDVGYTIGLRTGLAFPSWWPVTSWGIDYKLMLSLQPFEETCSDIYYVPVPDTYVIDPTIETPLGMEGTPPDDQIYPTVMGQYYMVEVENSWNDGTDERTDAAVSYDGITWMPWSEFLLDAVCIEMPPGDLNEDHYTVYYLATTESLHIRANDETGEFGDNSQGENNFQYTIGLAFQLAEPVVCETQFTYDPEDDWLASVQVHSELEDGVQAVTEFTEPLEAGAWYAIEVASGSWNEPGGTPRFDMDFRFEFTDGWMELSEDADNVYCTSTDGKTVYIQVPDANELHLRVNDQDSNFANNTGTLGVNIYKTDFNRTITGCELEYDINELVSSDTVEGSAVNGKIFAMSLASSGGISLSYGLTPGAWYMLETTGGPWYVTWDYPGSPYNVHTQYYNMQVKVGDDGEWTALQDSAMAFCVVEIDALGHQRMYFQAPESGGNTYHIRVAGASAFTKGAMGWNLYQAVDLNIGEVTSCTDFTYDPNNANGFGTVDPKRENGVDIIGLETNSYFAIHIESDNEASDPPYYAKSGWYEEEGGDERDDLELSINGAEWADLPNAPGVICYYYTPETDELVFFVRVINNQSWKLRANSESFGDNEGIEYYRVYEATADNNPWVSCIDDFTPSVPALNEHEWIPPQDEEGVLLMPTLTYTEGADPDDDGIIFWGQPGLEPGHHYMVETKQGPWKNGEDTTGLYSAQLSSDGGSNWYSFEGHPDVICADVDQLNHHWRAIFEVTDGQMWKIRVDDTETEFWPDNTGNLAYRLNLVNEFPIEGPGDYVYDYDLGAFDVCSQSLVRPQALSLSEIGSLGNYIGDWVHYINRSLLSYFAWCDRHTELIISAMEALKLKEPLATLAALDTISKNVMAEIDSYSWDGGYEDTSIFTGNAETMFNKVLPQGGVADDPWDGGNLITFGDTSLPAYYYNCQNVFADYLPARLQQATCFVSAYWKETGASFWVQLSLDLAAIGVLFVMVKGSLQSLIYMMTGVRPWTKDGAIKLAGNLAEGDPFRDSQINRTLEAIERQNEERNRRYR